MNPTSEAIDRPVVAIIQARMGSSRLPGKSMAEIENHPMLWHVIERVKRAHLVDHVVVATSTAPADDVIEELCREIRIRCYRGSESDVLDRYYQAASAEKAAQIVRITADCPLIDPEVIDRVIRHFQTGGLDYAANFMVRTYPDGLDTEIFSFSALERAWRESSKPSEREHVTPYLRSGKFRTANVENDTTSPFRHRRWTVDEPQDLEFIRAIYRAFRPRTDFGMNDVLQLLEKDPALEKINADIVSNAGYYKSLFDDARADVAPLRSIEKSRARIERSQIGISGPQTSGSRKNHLRPVAPLVIAKVQGCRVWDVDGNEYIDYTRENLPQTGSTNETANATHIEANGRLLQEGLNAMAKQAGLQSRIQCTGCPPRSSIRFLDSSGEDSLLLQNLFTQECAKRGVLLLDRHHLTAAHDSLAIEGTLKVYAEVCKTIGKWMSDPQPESHLEDEMIQPDFTLIASAVRNCE